MKPFAIALVALLAVAEVASAQVGGGRHGPGRHQPSPDRQPGRVRVLGSVILTGRDSVQTLDVGRERREWRRRTPGRPGGPGRHDGPGRDRRDDDGCVLASSIQLSVAGNGVDFTYVAVKYENQRYSQQVRVRERFADGTSSRWIDLPSLDPRFNPRGEVVCIDEITIAGSTDDEREVPGRRRPVRSRPATVTVLAY